MECPVYDINQNSELNVKTPPLFLFRLSQAGRQQSKKEGPDWLLIPLLLIPHIYQLLCA